MEVTNIQAQNLNEAFWLCCRRCLEVGHTYTIDEGSYKGSQRKEFDLVVIQVERPWELPLAPLTPEGVPNPTTDKDIEKYCAYLLDITRQPNEEYTYGEDLGPQVEEIIKKYREGGPNNNQLTMTIGSKDSILLKDPQCLRLVDTRIRYGKLHFIVYFRSWDLWAGFPVNMGGLQLVKEYMAGSIGVKDGELIGISKGLHLYSHFWKYAAAMCNKEV